MLCILWKENFENSLPASNSFSSDILLLLIVKPLRAIEGRFPINYRARLGLAQMFFQVILLSRNIATPSTWVDEMIPIQMLPGTYVRRINQVHEMAKTYLSRERFSNPSPRQDPKIRGPCEFR